ncbi:MAG: hypothetical protein IKE29_16285 [Paenibacillus sp.]|uniref:hypothetical protein n=1 Tax=Paenibacillus sp. TaxID=58172 RepID=UPI0025E36899|nr:hypothetical protein [Paenibacillus sp.]MBR2566163.1 hypothetical protein [Paenibacillus sp.]
MTREEKVHVLEQIKDYLCAGNPIWDVDMVAEAMDAGIEALQDVPDICIGRWQGGELGECSVCGHRGCASDIWDRCAHTYCPNCGSKLEVGK